MNRSALLYMAGLLVCSATSARAGDLNPPVGPIAPTHKTLTELEPRTPIGPATTPGDANSVYRITQPGSYYLTANVAGAAGKSGIEIASAGVSIDLMGFAVLGTPGSLSGIMTDAVYANILVCNGTVANWGDVGIDLAAASGCPGTIIERVASSGNGSYGIRCGLNGVIRACNASGNLGTGIIAYNTSLVEECNASNNGTYGMLCGAGSTVRGCVVRDNTSDGINIGTSGVVLGCSAYSNGGDGFDLGIAGLVEACEAAANDLHGIRVSSDGIVRGNVARANGVLGAGAGIAASGGDNRIEGNNCVDNPVGIDVAAAGNFITRNTCSGNATNWNVAIGNACLVVLASTNPAAISGNSGGVAPGSTDPNANFTY